MTSQAPTNLDGGTQTRINIQGMTCVSCERRIEKQLMKLPQVTHVDVSAKKGRATLTLTKPLPTERLEKAIEDAGYKVGKPLWVTWDEQVWKTFGIGILVVGLIVYLAAHFGLSDLGATLTSGKGTGTLMVLLVGLVAGVSTCMALVGGMILAVASTYPTTEDSTTLQRLRPHLVFQAGRILGFFLLGTLLGAVGLKLSMPANVQGALTILIAVIMVLLGLRLLGISPRLAAWTPTLPGSWGNALSAKAGEGKAYSHTRAATLGALTFFLPCGFTQAVQLYAITLANPLQSGLVMALFAIGTLPGLLTLAGVGTLKSSKRKGLINAMVGTLLLAFALINTQGALNVLGVHLPTSGTTATQALSSNVKIVAGKQIVTMTQTGKGYEPAVTYLYSNLPTEWQITGTSEYTCDAYLRVPSMSKKVELKQGPNSVDLGTLQEGTTDFTCVMGMYNGQLIVIPQPATPTATPSK